MSSVEVHEYDFRNIKEFATISILGKRRTGKTSWAKYIVGHLGNKCHRYLVMCGNRDNITEWREIISPSFIMVKNIHKLEEIRRYQDSKCSEYTHQGKEIPLKYRLTIIFDDCGADRKFMHHPTMRDLLSNGRHYGMYIFTLAQYLNQMHSENRDQLDYIGVLFTANSKNLKKIHDEFISVCDIRVFQYLVKSLTTNHGLCWIDNTTNPSDISECIFYKTIVPWPYQYKPVESDDVRRYAEEHYIDSNFTQDLPLISDLRQHVTDNRGGLVIKKMPHV